MPVHLGPTSSGGPLYQRRTSHEASKHPPPIRHCRYENCFYEHPFFFKFSLDQGQFRLLFSTSNCRVIFKSHLTFLPLSEKIRHASNSLTDISVSGIFLFCDLILIPPTYKLPDLLKLWAAILSELCSSLIRLSVRWSASLLLIRHALSADWLRKYKSGILLSMITEWMDTKSRIS